MKEFVPASRKDEERHTLETFLNNRSQKLNPALLDYSFPEPCDVQYDGVQYQITTGDQEVVAQKNKDISRKGNFLIIRSSSQTNDGSVMLKAALEKKVRKSDKNVTLLIDCVFSGNVWPEIRETHFKNFFQEHPSLRGEWARIFVVCRGQNIQLC